ncbi:MAG: hypothetical protein ACE366_07150 [Bradymonadia bacterium]
MLPLIALAVLSAPPQSSQEITEDRVSLGGGLIIGAPHTRGQDLRVDMAFQALWNISPSLAIGGEVLSILEGGSACPTRTLSPDDQLIAPAYQESCLSPGIALRAMMRWQVGTRLIGRLSVGAGPGYRWLENMSALGDDYEDPGFAISSVARAGVHFELVRLWGAGIQPGFVFDASTFDVDRPVFGGGFVLDAMFYD